MHARDQALLDRMADLLTQKELRIEQKRMFGGVAFMVRGHMCCGLTNKGDLMVRVPNERMDELLQWSGARPMDFTGKAMKGFLFVGIEGHRTDRELGKWIDLAIAHNLTMPEKRGKKK